jgi:hypothetical protein
VGVGRASYWGATFPHLHDRSNSENQLAQAAIDITVLSGTLRAAAVQFSSTGTLNEVSCNIDWAHRAWERCWRPAPRCHAPRSTQR